MAERRIVDVAKQAKAGKKAGKENGKSNPESGKPRAIKAVLAGPRKMLLAQWSLWP
jgi:hypothetical protein